MERKDCLALTRPVHRPKTSARSRSALSDTSCSLPLSQNLQPANRLTGYPASPCRPSDTCLFPALPIASQNDIDLAVHAARTALNTTWGKNVSGFERSRLINKLADLIERDAQDLAELEALNNGKPVKVARYPPVPFYNLVLTPTTPYRLQGFRYRR